MLPQKSRKRKSRDDATTVSATELKSELRTNPAEMKEVSPNDLEIFEILKDRAPKTSSEIHLLSDLRGLTNSEEKSMMYYAAALYCFGGDSSSQKFEKKYARNHAFFLADSVQTPDVQAVLATSSNSTTVMDFLRYTLHAYIMIKIEMMKYQQYCN